MSRLKVLLDREAARVEADPDALRSVLRARDTRQRNRRLGAVLVAVSITGVIVALFADALSLQDRDLQEAPLPYRHNGEIAVRADIDAGGGAIIQIDPATGREITLPVAGFGDLSYPIRSVQEVTDLWWSPDGEALAYLWAESLWVLDIESGESRIIVTFCDTTCQLAWSPDGTAIAVTNHSSVGVMNADGSDPTSVYFVEGSRYVHDPAWTPDGERILFAAETNTRALPGEGSRRRELYVVDRDGSDLTVLDELTFESPECCNMVAWSPDRTRVAYLTWRPYPGPDPIDSNGDPLGWRVGVAVADLDGSDRTIVLENAGPCCGNVFTASLGALSITDYPWLGWSPDGEQLALVISGPDQQQGLYLMNADGTDLRLIREGVHGRPAWRPVP